jgi:S-adenosyl-L-methionine hydrolase (adenosine-forming)
MKPAPPIITLLTDFGLTDHYVGAMKGVMVGICPQAQLVDISHQVTPFAIAEGAYTLGQGWSWFPEGTIHLVVVDPGVGSARRPIIVEAAGHLFVGPDNGVFDFVYEAVGGHKVREITATGYFRQPVSRTFHGRDIFSPVAAHLAAGVPQAEFGPTIGDFVRLHLSKPIKAGPASWQGIVLSKDRFGNVVTNFCAEDWQSLETGGFAMRIGAVSVRRIAETYAEVQPGELFLLKGSSGYLEISLNQGSAWERLQCAMGEPITLEVQKAL